jgi:serine/threonine protein kinase
MLRTQCLDENGALELLDGQLASSARTQVERHIESCDACRELVAELAKVEGEEETGAADTERTPLGESGNSAALVQAGPYRIEREVGSGSAGTVYRAFDTRMPSRVVALKYVTDIAWRARFGREVATLARLVHPSIVRYIDHGETAGGMYLAMEWLEGEDLEQCLRRGPLPWHIARVLALRLSSGLAHAHALGCVHRDLTPRNIFLPGGLVENAKLLDFGLVRVRDGLERTASQAVLGTPFYMSPEQVRDPKSVDARSDLFALGVVLYEAIAGVRPFSGDDLFTVWLRIVDLAPVDLRTITRGIPEAFILIIEALLAKDPAARPQSAGDVHQALLLLEGLARSAYPSTMGPAPMALPSRPIAVAGSGPVALPSRAISAMPPARRGSGVFVAAGVGVTALVAASTLAVVASRTLAASSMASSSGPESSPSAKPEPSEDSDDTDPPNDPAPASAAVQARLGAISDAGAAGVPTKGAQLAPPEHFFCGGDNVELRRGGHYEPEPGFESVGDAVIIGGDCKATLEDCTIGGAHSVRLIGTSASLTLRRCRVLGDVHLNGAVTLILEGTTLPKAPIMNGKARVIRH